MTRRVDIIVWCIQRKFQKVKIEVTGPKKCTIFESFQLNLPKTTFSAPVLIFNFFPLFPKMHQSILTIPVIFLYEILCSLNFLVELHLGVVLEVLLVVSSKFVDKYHRTVKNQSRLQNCMNPHSLLKVFGITDSEKKIFLW